MSWREVPASPGVSSKALGEFSERGTRLALYRLGPSATLRLVERSLYFVIAGAGEAAGSPYRTHTTVHVDAGESAEARADEMSEILHIGLPRFS